MNLQSPYSHRFWLLLIGLCLVFKGRSQSVQPVVIGTRYTTYSAFLGEERQYLVSLPPSYEQDAFYNGKRYPVAILLDADTHFQYAGGMVRFMSAGEIEQIPEMILVAVRNTDRTRDMTAALDGKTDNFLSFLEKELLPLIDRQYRTAPYRLLVGHSLAGLFTLNCLLDRRAFNAYIAIDPSLTWKDNAILRKAKTTLAGAASLTGRLYLTQADNPFEAGQHTGARGKAFDDFRAALAASRSARFVYRQAYYGQENHFSVPFQSLRDGLLFVFENYSFPFPVFLTQGSKGVSDHYKQFVEQLGVDLSPPGKVINQAGLFTLYNLKQIDKAIDLLLLNTLYYPTSSIPYTSLADAYKAKGDTVVARRHYQKASALKADEEKAGPARK